MSRQIQIRRGTATEHTTFTGAPGEVTMDMTDKTLRVHDGATPGGIPLARRDEIPAQTGGGGTATIPDNYDFVIESGGTTNLWYRKYKSGWIEQGGYLDGLGATGITIILPKQMNSNNYTVTFGAYRDASSGENAYIRNIPTATGFMVKSSSTAVITRFFWETKGFSA